MSVRVVCEPLPWYIVRFRCQQDSAQFRAVFVHAAPAVWTDAGRHVAAVATENQTQT